MQADPDVEPAERDSAARELGKWTRMQSPPCSVGAWFNVENDKDEVARKLAAKRFPRQTGYMRGAVC